MFGLFHLRKKNATISFDFLFYEISKTYLKMNFENEKPVLMAGGMR